MLAPGLTQDQFDYILPFAERAKTMGLGLRHLWVLRRKKKPKPQADGDSTGKGT